MVYDVVSGDVLLLRAAGVVDDAQCVIDDAAVASWDDPRSDPAPGQGYYYLVRSQTSCLTASYGFPTAGPERLPLSDCP